MLAITAQIKRLSFNGLNRRKLPDCRGEIKELTEGMCNVTYHIVFDDDSESILKIAAEDTTGNTSNEINLMKAEVSVMRLVSENCSFKVADIQYYDCSKTVCNGDYFLCKNCRVIIIFLLKINCLKMILQCQIAKLVRYAIA